MTIGLVGRKAGMTRVFTDAGDAQPVTVIEALPNRIVQVKDSKADGYRAVQVTFATRRASRLTKPVAGHYAKPGVLPGETLIEFRLAEGEGADLKSGAEIKVDLFQAGQVVDVTGRASPASVKTRVMPAFRPTRPMVMIYILFSPHRLQLADAVLTQRGKPPSIAACRLSST